MVAKKETPKRRRSPEEARRTILDATQRLLAEHGPDAIGLKDVASAAGVSHALVSHYFGTYEALVEETLRDYLQATRATMFARIADAPNAGPREWIDLMFEHLAHPLSGRLFAWAILSGRMDDDDFFPRRERGMRLVADALEMRARTQLSPEDVPSRRDLELGMLIVFSAALGYSVARNALWASLSHEPSEERDRWFRDSLGTVIEQLVPATQTMRSKKKPRR